MSLTRYKPETLGDVTTPTRESLPTSVPSPPPPPPPEVPSSDSTLFPKGRLPCRTHFRSTPPTQSVPTDFLQAVGTPDAPRPVCLYSDLTALSLSPSLFSLLFSLSPCLYLCVSFSYRELSWFSTSLEPQPNTRPVDGSSDHTSLTGEPCSETDLDPQLPTPPPIKRTYTL